MPELPEVESVRLGLEPIVNQKIQRVDWNYPNLWDKSTLDPTLLEGQKIQEISRKGKYLILHTQEFQLLVHLGMSGVIILQKVGDEARAHTHFELEFGRNKVLRYSDPRKFGHLHLAPKGHEFIRWLKLGPDAIGRAFSAQYLYQKCQKSTRDIKVFLLNQEVVAGVGNIYASEALHRAGIHPARPANSLSEQECQVLVKACKWILKKSIENRGTTFSDYRLTNGKGGSFQGFLQIFQKEGETCPKCKSTSVLKIEQDKRSTFYCPECQI